MDTPYLDPDGTPAEGTPAAQRQQLRAKFAQIPEVGKDGYPVTAAASTPAATFNALDYLAANDPATAEAVGKAADRLGIDHTTMQTLADSQSFIDAVTGAAPDEIAHAITTRTRPKMAPNPGQGHSGSPVVHEAPKSLRETIRDKGRAALGSYLRDLA